MRRPTLLLILALAVPDAAHAARLPLPPVPPHNPPRLRAAPRHADRPLPLPPIPPLRPPGALALTDAAPVPNRNLGAPVPPDAVTVKPTVFRPMQDVRGDGFMPGSAHENPEELPHAGAFGLQLHIPVD